MTTLARQQATERRQALGLTPTAVSRHLGLPHDAVRDFERHGTRLPEDGLERLERLLSKAEGAAAQGHRLVLEGGGNPVDRDPVLQRLIARRLELGVSQRDLARKLGVNADTVSNWERGFRVFRERRWQGEISRALRALAIEKRQKAKQHTVQWQTRLRARRVEAGLSQKRVARALGVPPSTLSQWENGVHRIPPRMVRMVEEVLKNALPDWRLPPEHNTPKADQDWQAALRGRRLAAGLTQRALAEATVLSSASIAAWERGRAPVPLAHAERINRALERLAAQRQSRIEARIQHNPEENADDPGDVASREPVGSSAG